MPPLVVAVVPMGFPVSRLLDQVLVVDQVAVECTRSLVDIRPLGFPEVLVVGGW